MRRGWLPALCAALQVITAGTGGTPTPSAPVGVAFALLGLASGVALVWRDRSAFGVFAFCAVVYPVQALLLAPPVPAAMAVMSFELLRRPHPVAGDARDVRRAVGALLVALLAGGVGLAVSGQAILVAPYALVLVTAAALGLLLASHDAREESRRRELLAEQRLRIARDLHDVVGHSVGAIGVQAGAARMALAAGVPQDAAGAVVHIETESRALLREVRWLVGLLREDAELPGLPQVDALLDSARRSGLALGVERSGPSDGVPPEVGNAAYRILQEALTNVMRHGDGHTADVWIEVTDEVHLRVSNSYAGRVTAEGGHGLVGLRERAAEVGGTVQVGSVRVGAAPVGAAQVGAVRAAGVDDAGGEAGTWVVEANLPFQGSR